MHQFEIGFTIHGPRAGARKRKAVWRHLSHVTNHIRVGVLVPDMALGRASRMITLTRNPDVLAPGYTCIAEIQSTWHAAHVKSRAEKAFAHDLRVRDIAYFLPMERYTIWSGGQKRTGMRVLFDGYVFVAHEDIAAISYSECGRHLCGWVPDANPGRLRKELIDLHMALSAGGILEKYNQPVAGERWRVSHGPFEGVEGIVVSRVGDKARFILLVTAVASAYSLEVRLDHLEGPVGPVN